MSQPEVYVYPFRDFATAAAEEIARQVDDRVRAEGNCSLALSGGSTPLPVYEALAEMGEEIPWDLIAYYFVDERCVPPDHEDSNYRLVVNHLFWQRHDLLSRVRRIEGEDPNPDHAAARYEQQLPSRIDVMVLGIGEDGHTGSLFPGATSLLERSRRVVAVESPKPPSPRITLSPAMIRKAGQTIVLAAGKSKSPAVAAALQADSNFRKVPAQIARKGIWVLDEDAASLLSEEVLQ